MPSVRPASGSTLQSPFLFVVIRATSARCGQRGGCPQGGVLPAPWEEQHISPFQRQETPCVAHAPSVYSRSVAPRRSSRGHGAIVTMVSSPEPCRCLTAYGVAGVPGGGGRRRPVNEPRTHSPGLPGWTPTETTWSWRPPLSIRGSGSPGSAGTESQASLQKINSQKHSLAETSRWTPQSGSEWILVLLPKAEAEAGHEFSERTVTHTRPGHASTYKA